MIKKSILFVDDERKILSGLRRTLYPLRDEWDMTFVESGSDALAYIKENQPIVIVSDMRMPGMNGFELLTSVRQHYPEVVRVMLTAQPDKDLYQKAMTVSHYFLWKPSSFEAFSGLLGRIQDLNTILQNEKLVKLIGSITSFPSPSELYVRLTDLIENPEIDSAQIAAVMSEDMAMAAQILKLINSVMFGLSRQIETLEEAVSYLGVETIRSLVLARQFFSRCNDETCQIFKLDHLWEHSVRTATFAHHFVAERAPEIESSHHAYLAGLLHDIGKLVLIYHLPDMYKNILEEVAVTGRCQADVEREQIGVDHSAIGAYLTHLWGLPRELTEAISLHHNPIFAASDKKNTSLISEAVWSANRRSHEAKI